MNRRLDNMDFAIAGLTDSIENLREDIIRIIVILGETNKNFAEKYMEYGDKTIEELTEMMANLTPEIRAELEREEPVFSPVRSNGGRPNRRQKRSSNRKQNNKSNRKQNRKSNKQNKNNRK